MKRCFFCDAPGLDDGRIFLESKNFYTRWDEFPVARGHCQVVSKQHIDSYFDLAPHLAREMHGLAQQVKVIIDEKFGPEGYTLGINDGAASGRTQDHLHMHVIPRYFGDILDPEGGIRNIVSGKGNYAAAARAIGRGEYIDE